MRRTEAKGQPWGTAALAWTIAEWEFLDHVRGGRLWLVGLLCCILAPLGTTLNARSFVFRKQHRDRAVAEYQSRLAALRSLRPDSASIRAFHDPPPLSVLASGSESQLPEYVLIAPEGLVEQASPSASANPASGFVMLDYLFVSSVILSLLAVLLSFDAIAGERETHKLALVLANPVPRNALFLGKFAGGFLILLLAAGATFGLSLLASLVSGVGWTDAPMRLGLFFLATVLHLTCWQLIGLALSASGLSARTGLVTGLTVWIALALAARPASLVVATLLRPSVPTSAWQGAKQAAYAQGLAEQTAALSRVYFQRFGGPTKAGIDFDVYLRQEPQFSGTLDSITRVQQARLRQQIRALDGDVLQRRRGQNELAERLSFLSPTSLYYGAATNLAGTGGRAWDRFYDAVRSYESLIDRLLYDNGGTLRFSTGEFGSSNTASLTVNRRTLPPDQVPLFAERPPAISDVWRSAATSLAGLAFGAGCFFVVALFLMRRLDVR